MLYSNHTGGNAEDGARTDIEKLAWCGVVKDRGMADRLTACRPVLRGRKFAVEILVIFTNAKYNVGKASFLLAVSRSTIFMFMQKQNSKR